MFVVTAFMRFAKKKPDESGHYELKVSLWIQNHVFDALAFVGVGNVDLSVGGLDHRGVRELAAIFFFERQQGRPGFPVSRSSDI